MPALCGTQCVSKSDSLSRAHSASMWKGCVWTSVRCEPCPAHSMSRSRTVYRRLLESTRLPSEPLNHFWPLCMPAKQSNMMTWAFRVVNSVYRQVAKCQCGGSGEMTCLHLPKCLENTCCLTTIFCLCCFRGIVLCFKWHASRVRKNGSYYKVDSLNAQVHWLYVITKKSASRAALPTLCL